MGGVRWAFHATEGPPTPSLAFEIVILYVVGERAKATVWAAFFCENK